MIINYFSDKIHENYSLQMNISFLFILHMICAVLYLQILKYLALSLTVVCQFLTSRRVYNYYNSLLI